MQSPHIILIHGLGEHCSRYDSFFSKFVELGASASGFDLPGHGDTLKANVNQKPGHIIGLELVFKIIDALYDEARDQGKRLTLVLLCILIIWLSSGILWADYLQ